MSEMVGEWIKGALVVALVVMAGLLVRDVVVNAEARRAAERQLADAHYRADTAWAELRDCREIGAQGARHKVQGVTPVSRKDAKGAKGK